MIRYTLKRLTSLFISLAVASLLIFFVIEIAPGGAGNVLRMRTAHERGLLLQFLELF